MMTFQVASKDLIHSMCTDLHTYNVVARASPARVNFSLELFSHDFVRKNLE